MGISHAVHALVASGHKLEDIREYTYRQFRLFLAAAKARELSRDKSFLILTRVAQHMPGKDFKEFLDDNFKGRQ